MEFEQHQIFFNDTYRMKLVTEIAAQGVADGRRWISTRENIFHPQGGGQPADSGTAGGMAVTPRWSQDIAGRVDLIVIDESTAPTTGAVHVGDQVELAIDPERRLRHAALHTAGHLLDAAIRRRGYRHLVSNHFPDEARIEFATDGRTDDLDELRDAAHQEVEAAIRVGVPVTTSQDETGRRTVVIGSFSTDVCGGTHVASTAHIVGFAIRSTKVKKGRLKVGYTVEHVGE